MRRFAFACNNNDRLLLSTPTITAANQGLYVVSSMFDQAEWSMGFRFRLASVSGTQFLLQNTISTSTKNKNWEIYMVDNSLRYSTAATGSVSMFADLVAGVDYYFWMDAYEEYVYCYLFDTSNDTEYGGDFAQSYNLASDSIVTVLSDYEKSSPATGATIWDLAFIPGVGEHWSTFKHGGIHKYFFYSFWPMREGTGTICRNLINTAIPLLTGGTFSGNFSWTSDDDDESKRWQ